VSSNLKLRFTGCIVVSGPVEFAMCTAVVREGEMRSAAFDIGILYARACSLPWRDADHHLPERHPMPSSKWPMLATAITG
jgi:hypothetical protein